MLMISDNEKLKRFGAVKRYGFIAAPKFYTSGITVGVIFGSIYLTPNYF